MSNKIEAHKSALEALEKLQDFTKSEYPVGTLVNSKRGRGEALFKVVGYHPAPTSIDLANSVLGLSKNEKTQVLNLAGLVKVVALPQA
jgi:hypothetical protein